MIKDIIMREKENIALPRDRVIVIHVPIILFGPSLLVWEVLCVNL